MTPAFRRIAETVREIALRVDRNLPSHRDPEAFHVEKSEIVAALRRLARSMNDTET